MHPTHLISGWETWLISWTVESLGNDFLCFGFGSRVVTKAANTYPLVHIPADSRHRLFNCKEAQGKGTDYSGWLFLGDVQTSLQPWVSQHAWCLLNLEATVRVNVMFPFESGIWKWQELRWRRVQKNLKEGSAELNLSETLHTLTTPLEGWPTVQKIGFCVLQGSQGPNWHVCSETRWWWISKCIVLWLSARKSLAANSLWWYGVLSVWLFQSIEALGSLSSRKPSQATFTHLICSCLIVFSLKTLSANFLPAARLSLLSCGLVYHFGIIGESLFGQEERK